MRKSLLVAMVAVVVMGRAGMGQVPRPDPTLTKSSESLRAVFKEVVAGAEKATVVVQAQTEKEKSTQVALGTVVGADGLILTKASEVMGKEKLQVVVGEKTLDAKVVGVSEQHDLAMLKVGATGLAVAPWAEVKDLKVEVGEWVASAGAAGGDDEPIAVGVVSVARRKIPGRSGFLGVMMANAPADGGAEIKQVVPGSAAEKAGLKVDDVITGVNGKAMANMDDLHDEVQGLRPGDVVSLSVKRGEEKLELKATLGANAAAAPRPQAPMMNLMGGAVSKRASDFPAVFQHDTVIRPMDCGGPLVDLSGKVIGINIARAGRTETYALPTDVIEPLLGPLASGMMAPAAAAPPAPAKKGGAGMKKGAATTKAAETKPAETKPVETKPADAGK